MSYPIIPIFIPHVGCPNDCVFCNQRRIAGTLCAPKPEEVSALIASALKKTPRAQVAFYGGSFTAIDALQQEAYLAATADFGDAISGIRISTRPDAINNDILRRLKKYGVTIIELGAQSMDNEVLEKSKRGHSAQDTVRASKAVHEAGFSLILQMMVGLPGDCAAGTFETAKEIIKLTPHGVRIYPVVVIRDTALADMWQRREYTSLDVEEAVPICATLQELFEEARIPIIRMGLNPTEDLSGGDALAGAYHPAFGQLVSAYRWYKRIFDVLKCGEYSNQIAIYVHPSQVSNVAGHHAKNREALKVAFSLKKIKIIPDKTQNMHEMQIANL